MADDVIVANPLTLVAVGFAPGLFWLWQLVRRLRGRTEPLSLITRTFLLGVVFSIPIATAAAFVAAPADLAQKLFGLERSDPLVAAWTAFAVAGVCEEIGKFLVIRLSLGNSPYMRDRMAGMLFGATVALGFASVENCLYMLDFGWQVILPRAVLSTVGHVLSGLMWGYALGATNAEWARQGYVGRRRWGWVSFGLLAAIFLHGVFDYVLFLERPESGSWAVMVFCTELLIGVALWRRGRLLSRDRYKRAPRTTQCRSCGHCTTEVSSRCDNCGAPGGSSGYRFACGACLRELDPDWAYCGGCGSRVLGTADEAQCAELNAGQLIQLQTQFPRRTHNT